MRRAFWVAVLAVGGAGLVAGCGGGPAAATVSGEVLVDGKPLENGTISFTPPDGKGDTATIKGGRYEAKTSPGNNRVSISESRPGPKRPAYNGPDAPLLETTEEGVLEKYNVNSDLTFDAKPGSNTKDWKVEGKPRKK